MINPFDHAYTAPPTLPYEQIAQPFEWKFTRQDLDQVLDRVEQAPQPLPSPQAA